MKQSEIFRNGEAAAWFARNQDKLDKINDPVVDIIDQSGVIPEVVLEIGCADGWRLRNIEQKYGAQTCGIDPMQKVSMTAEKLWDSWLNSFDLVIYGFCLYLVDPVDYFRVVSEGNRVLKDGGYLIIHDFADHVPHKVPYKHKEGVWSHHMDFSRFWLAHPAYSLFLRREIDGQSVTMLKKNLAGAFPERTE